MSSGCSLEIPGSGPPFATGETLDGSFTSPAGGFGDAGSVAPVPGYEAGSSALSDAGVVVSDASSGCSINGRYAVEVVFDVSWVGTQFASIVPIISPGEGELSFVVLGELVELPNGVVDLAFRACQAKVPEFISTIPQERYAVRFSNMLWDSPGMPIFRGSVASCREPGCALHSTPIRAQIGSALADPAGDWPGSAKEGKWADHDGDGRPGVSAFMLGPSAGRGIAYPPVDLLEFRRVQKLDLGMRVNLTLNGKRDGCNGLAGEIEEGSIDTRGLDCVATTRPMACTADELTFLDDNLPAWTVRQGTFRGMRVSDNADCEEVRQMFGFEQSAAP